MGRAIARRLAAEHGDELRRLHDVDGLSIGEIADRFGVTRTPARNALILVGVTFRTSSDPICRQQTSRARRRRTPIADKLRSEAGGCGSPTCRDPECNVRIGGCHREGCERDAVIAYRTDSAIRWVKGEPALYCASGVCALRAREVNVQTEASEACRAYCEEHELWTRAAAGEQLEVDERTLDHYVDRGLIEVAEERKFGAITFRLFRISDVKRFMRDRRAPADGRARLHHDPNFVFRWALRRWPEDPARAKALAARSQQRVRHYARIRTGPKPAAERHARWSLLWHELRAEFPDEDPKRLIADVALIDWQQHPEDWPRERYPARRDDPDDFADGYVREAARDRIRAQLLRKTAA